MTYTLDDFRDDARRGTDSSSPPEHPAAVQEYGTTYWTSVRGNPASTTRQPGWSLIVEADAAPGQFRVVRYSGPAGVLKGFDWLGMWAGLDGRRETR